MSGQTELNSPRIWWLGFGAAQVVEFMKRIWNTRTREQIRLQRLAGHTNEITDVAFSNGGQRMVSVDIRGGLLVWKTTQSPR